MKSLLTLWKFSRPHTIIGTILSITTLYLIFSKIQYANGYNQGKVNLIELFFADFPTYLLTLIACISCNLFITGLNQIYDIDIDRINKPNLPLITGELNTSEAKRIIVISGLIAISLAFNLSYYFGGLICFIMILGIIYSVPPFRLKQSHLWAASFISLVRGILVNLGIYIHFHILLAGFPIKLPSSILMLTLFITLFSIGIAWFKDLPDIEGDSQHNIGSLAVKKSPKFALTTGTILVGLGYVTTIIYAIVRLNTPSFKNYSTLDTLNSWLFVIYHIVGLIAFLLMVKQLNINNKNGLKRFYRSYWILFFLEYLSFLMLLK